MLVHILLKLLFNTSMGEDSTRMRAMFWFQCFLLQNLWNASRRGTVFLPNKGKNQLPNLVDFEPTTLPSCCFNVRRNCHLSGTSVTVLYINLLIYTLQDGFLCVSWGTQNLCDSISLCLFCIMWWLPNFFWIICTSIWQECLSDFWIQKQLFTLLIKWSSYLLLILSWWAIQI